MNKLCCKIKSDRNCLGCGAQWCFDCTRKVNWDPKGEYEHRAVDSEWSTGWRCPVAGIVYGGRRPTQVGEPFDFVLQPPS